MFGLRPLSRALPPRRTWTCRDCVRNQLRTSFQQQQFCRGYAREATKPRPKGTLRIRKREVALIAFLAGGYGWLVGTEQGKFVGSSVARTFRVVRTLIVCINDYRNTLKKQETSSPEQYDQLLKSCHQRCAELTLEAMKANGSIFIKLGQHLSSLNYLLPNEWCDTFIPLQDHCPITSFESVQRMVEHDTGRPFHEVFKDFGREPEGAASLAQVHIAVDVQSGRKVAVKVQHPVLDERAPLDLQLTRLTFLTLKRAFPDYDLTWLSDEMEKSLPQELDFALEGQNATRCRNYFSKLSFPLVIPEVLWARRRILVMEYITGARPDDLEYLDSHNISRDEVSATLSHIFNTMIFAPDAPLHCDPHGGNIAVREYPNPSWQHPANFEVILYDHGLYRTIPRDLQRNYAKLWLAVLDADEDAMRKYSYEVAGITDEQFPLFASAITGRDYRVVAQGVQNQDRTEKEKENISNALGEGLLQQLVQLLGDVPRIILLILKTNDLTRSLDVNLHTKHGPMRSFLILAHHAARAVWDEQLELLRHSVSGLYLWPPRNAKTLLVSWYKLQRIEWTLYAYEWLLWARGIMGWDNEMGMGDGNPLAS